MVFPIYRKQGIKRRLLRQKIPVPFWGRIIAVSMTAGNPYGSRAAHGERQKSYGTDGAAGMFMDLSAGEISLTALWRKGVTGLDMTSEIFL